MTAATTAADGDPPADVAELPRGHPLHGREREQQSQLDAHAPQRPRRPRPAAPPAPSRWRSRRCTRACSSTTCTTDVRRNMSRAYAAAFSDARPFAAPPPTPITLTRFARNATPERGRSFIDHGNATRPSSCEHRALPDLRITRDLDRDDLRALVIQPDDLQVVEQLAVLVGLVLTRVEVRHRTRRRRRHERQPDISTGILMTHPASLSTCMDTRPPSHSEHDEYVANRSD